MKIKNILLSSIIGLILFSNNAVALVPVEQVPSKVSYYTGWRQSADTASKFIEKSSDTDFAVKGSRIDALNIAFLRWDGFGNIKDDNGVLYTTGWKSNEYNELRKIATAVNNGTISGKKTKFIVAFGGYSYAGMWDILLQDDLRETLAKNIVALMGNKIGKFWDGYKVIPGVNIDGIDFDFERSIRITPELNDAFVKLVERIRVLQADSAFLKEINVAEDSVKDDMIVLTTYHTGADKVECGVNLNLGPKDGCSFVAEKRSVHHGEVLRLLENIKDKNLFDSYNIMLYDAGKGKYYHPDVSIDNYIKYIPANRVNGGISIKPQWGPDGSFIQSQSVNTSFINLFKEKGLNGYFTWSLGGTEKSAQDIEEHYYYAKIWENVINDDTKYIPEEFIGSDAQIKSGTKAMLGIDHTIVTENEKTYVVVGGTWYETESLTDDSSPIIDAKTIYATNGVDITSEFIKSKLEEVKNLTLGTANGAWAGNIFLPNDVKDGTILRVLRTAGWGTDVHSGSLSISIPRGTSIFTFKNGKWRYSGDLTIYATNGVDITPEFIKSKLEQVKNLTLGTANGAWAGNIFLPYGVDEGTKINLFRKASWGTTVHMRSTSMSLLKGRTTFTFNHGEWKQTDYMK